MARRSLKPQLNQIRTWARQGRTDAWMAHQLEVTVQQIEDFRRENDLAESDGDEGGTAPVRETGEEIDLRAEDDALIAAELEAAAAEEKVEMTYEDAAVEAPVDIESEAPRRRRGSRGGRSRRTTAASSKPLEGTFDHGEEGYGLWLDPAIVHDAVYAEHWAGHRPVEVVIEADQILIRRSGEQ